MLRFVSFSFGDYLLKKKFSTMVEFKHWARRKRGGMEKRKGEDRKQQVSVSVGLHIITFSLHDMGKEMIAQ